MVASPHRPIPGTGLLVPRGLDDEPPRLAERWTAVARETLAAYHAAWRRRDDAAVAALCDWLAAAAPPLLVTGGGRIVWDPEAPARIASLRRELAGADVVAVAGVQADLDVIAQRTRAFLAAVVDREALGAAADLAELRRGRSAGESLARLATTRMPDYRANLVARALMRDSEREVYVRHNIRTLRGEYPVPHLWRMLVRYLFEYQYLLPALGLTRVADPRSFFLHSTWFADDVLATGVLDEARFDALATAMARLCACHAVDATRLRLPPVTAHDTGAGAG